MKESVVGEGKIDDRVTGRTTRSLGGTVCDKGDRPYGKNLEKERNGPRIEVLEGTSFRKGPVTQTSLRETDR